MELCKELMRVTHCRPCGSRNLCSCFYPSEALQCLRKRAACQEPSFGSSHPTLTHKDRALMRLSSGRLRGNHLGNTVTKIIISALMRTLPCGSVPPPQDLTSFLLPLLHSSVSLVGRCDVDVPFMAEHFRALAYRNSQCLEMHAQDLYKIKRD